MEYYNNYSWGCNYMQPTQPQNPYGRPADPYTYPQNFPMALQLIRDAVSGEMEDRLFYSYLISVAPSQEDKEIIASIRDDEMKHFDLFRQIYFQLTGQILPQPREGEFTKPATYCQGLKQALLGELAAVQRYRRILFAMQDRRHINMLTEIITDEIRHANLYNLLYSKNGCYAEELEGKKNKTNV